MKYKILVVNDFHKKMKDVTTIKGYVDVQNKVQSELTDSIVKEGFNKVIINGDWYDGGYGSDTASVLAHTEADRKMYETLGGELYGVIGNHIRVRMDSNPELFLIQPHPYFKTRVPVDRDYQIIKTPDKLLLNGVQISLCHHNRYAKGARDYIVERDENAHYHIALYHTEDVIPSNVLYNAGYGTMVSEDSQIAECLWNVDYAIVGHIHKPIGAFPIRLPNGRVCTMCIPGSLTNTDSGLNARHDYVDAPVIEIDDDGKVTHSYFRINMHTDELHFAEKVDNSATKLKTIRGNAKKNLYTDEEEITTLFENDPKTFTSLNSFMLKQGYSDSDKELIQTVLDSPTDIKKLMEIWNKRESEESLI